MFTVTLVAHSLLRWLVVALGLLAAGRAIAGWSGARPWTNADERATRAFAIALDTQVLFGLLLYLFLSETTTAAFRNLGSAWSEGAVRFWVVDHPLSMIVALALAHIGLARARRPGEPAQKHRRAAIFLILSMAAILAGMPWPFSNVARPLLPLG